MDIIIDIGACNGATVQKYLSNYKVYAFEPLPYNYNQMPSHSNLTLVKAAAGAFNGKMNLFLGPKNTHLNCYWGTSLFEDKPNVTDTEYIEVDVVKLSDYFKKHINRKVKLLRMNCEGSEYDIFEDLLDANLINEFERIAFQDHTLDVPSLVGRSKKVFKRLQSEYKGVIQFINNAGNFVFDIPEYLK